MTLGKCTEAMENCLEGEETYKDIDGESDVIRLLLLINSIAYSYKIKILPCPGHPHGTEKILHNPSIKLIVV